MKVYLVLEFYPYEGFAEPGDVVYDSREKAEAHATELRLKSPGDYTVFEMEVN